MRNLNVLTTAMAALALVGCGSSMGTNRSMYSVHQPVVERTNYAIDLNSDGDDISLVEQTRLAEWFDALKLGYGDRVSIDNGTGLASSTGTRAVARIAADRGIILETTAPVTEGQIAPGMLRVVVTRSSASVPSCPNWSSSDDRNFNTSNHSNHGCAVNRILRL